MLFTILRKLLKCLLILLKTVSICSVNFNFNQRDPFGKKNTYTNLFFDKKKNRGASGPNVAKTGFFAFCGDEVRNLSLKPMLGSYPKKFHNFEWKCKGNKCQLSWKTIETNFQKLFILHFVQYSNNVMTDIIWHSR